MNAANASQAGLRLGAYIYSYATSVEMAQQEADFVLNLIKDYPISFPVVFDAEDANTLGTLTQSQVSDVINAFCKRIQDAGYYPMVYANEYWIANKSICRRFRMIYGWQNTSRSIHIQRPRCGRRPTPVRSRA